MDELDVKIMRSLISERAISLSNASVWLSLRGIVARLGADDMTVRYRYNKLKESNYLSIWSLLINPAYFGQGVAEVILDVQSESTKPDMIRKLKLIHEITGLVNFYGKAISIYMIYAGEESRSRTIELISRITKADRITQLRMLMPHSLTKDLTETDAAIICAVSMDTRKSTIIVAKELGLSSKTVTRVPGPIKETSNGNG
jgi:DNA-binding Lrp family transcriptional regulator